MPSLDLGTLLVRVRSKGTEETSRALQSLSSAGKACGKAIAVGSAAATAAIAALGTQAIKAYGDYEQLTGGVETLFKESADVVKNYANEAYISSGLSANNYMETITGFSASLLQSLGNDTAKAAEYGNQAVIDMSDNANKMGTSMESIQNAYQGFAKQNYTMLDNLKLGYGGTKEEMQRLLNDAQKISGVQYDLSSFADITQAIHVIQTEMGITGTTAEEASTTIQGSFNMMKAGWANLLTAMTDPNQDLSAIIDNLFQSVMTFGDNLIPRVQNVLQGISTALEKFAPMLIEKIPALIEQLIPSLTAGINSLLNTVTSLLSGIIPMLLNVAGELAPTITNIVMQIGNMIIQNLPLLIDAALQIILTLAQGLTEALPQMIPNIIDVVLSIGNTLIDNLDLLVDTAIEMVIALADGLIQGLPILIEKAPQIVIKLYEKLVENAPKLIDAAIQLIVTLGKGLIANIPVLVKNIPAIIKAMFAALTAGAQIMATAGKHLIQGLWNGIADTVEWLKGKVKGVVNKIKSWFTGKDGFDEHSPSKWAYQVAAYLMQGLANGITDDMSAEEAMQKKCDNIKSILSDFTSSYELDQEIAKSKYDLWLSSNQNATDSEKERKQIEMLNEQRESQFQNVMSVNEAYKAQCALTGENSEQSKQLQKQLLQEAQAYNELSNTLDQLNQKKKGLYSGFNTLDEYVKMLNNKNVYDQFINTHATKYRASGMTNEGIKDVARRISGYDGVTVYQNFYTKTATPSEVYNATKKAANDMEVAAGL